MWKTTLLALLLCISKPLVYNITPTDNFTLNAPGMVFLDYHIDSTGQFFGLFANSTGFQVMLYRAGASPLQIIPFLSCYVDLTNLSNPYNPQFADQIATYLLVVVKPTYNTLGGFKYLIITTSPFAFGYMYKGQSYYYRARRIKYPLNNGDTYYMIDELGNQYWSQMANNNAILYPKYNMTPVTNKTYAGFDSISIYGLDSTVILTDNYLQRIIVASANPTFIRNKYLLNTTVVSANFLLSQNIAYFSLANNTLVIAKLSPFAILNSYPRVPLQQKFTFYDVVSNSLIFVTEINEEVCFYQFDLMTGSESSLSCYQNSTLRYSSNSSLLILQDTSIILVKLYDCEYAIANNYFLNYCTVCASGCQFCSSLNQCLTCLLNFDFTNNYCCPTGLIANITMSATNTVLKTCISCSPNCISCIDNATCLECKVNFTLASNLCQEFIIVPNNTAPANNTNSTNTNSSANNTANSNSSNSITPSQNYTQNSSQIQVLTPLEEIAALLESSIQKVNKIPSIRSILQFMFSSMITFDDMYLFYYHEREYGNATRAFLQNIRKLQNDKWQAMSTFLGSYFESITLVQQYIQSNLDYYLDYSSKRFIDIQGNGQGLIINSWNFITTNLLTSAIIFIGFQVLFWLTFNFKISKFFRPYSFALYFVYFILEGNTQALVFYASSSFRLSFSLNPANKLLLSVNYIFGFFFVLFCICGYFLLYKSLKKFLKYFLQNITKFQQMVIFLTLTLGIKNLLFGFVHSQFRGFQQTKTQLCLLLLIEFCCMGCYIFFLMKDGFEFKIKVWIIFIIQLLRIMFIFVLFLQQSYQQSAYILQLCQIFLSPLLKLYIKMAYIGIFVNFILLFSQAINQIISLMRKEIFQKKKDMQPVPVCSKRQKKHKKLIEMIRIEYVTNAPSKTALKRQNVKLKSQIKHMRKAKVQKTAQVLYVKFNQ